MIAGLECGRGHGRVGGSRIAQGRPTTQAQLLERLQLASYASSEKYDALKYRPELMRPAIVHRLASQLNSP